jgi:hypothetical protein
MYTTTEKECEETKQCEYQSLKRANFFPGMLLGDQDFKDEQLYHIESRKRLVRYLVGWGIVCGLEIERVKNQCAVKIKPGFALDCQGNAIEVCQSVSVDLSKQCRKQPKQPCDPKNPELRDLYIALRYGFTKTDSVPVYAPGGDCEQSDCEPSRIQEGFCVEILDKCPTIKPCKDDKDGLLKRFFEARMGKYKPEDLCSETPKEACLDTPPCFESCCGDDAVIVLGKVTLDCQKGNIVAVNCECRSCLVWAAPLRRQLICELFGNVDDMIRTIFHIPDDDDEPVPDASMIECNPLQAALVFAALFAKQKDRMKDLEEKYADVEKRLGSMEDKYKTQDSEKK